MITRIYLHALFRACPPVSSNDLGRPANQLIGGAMLRIRMIAVLAALVSQSALAQGQIDAVADFYKGKTINIFVGYQAGGGYDLYARVLAQFLGRHIPGQPTVIVQNMPGAGGLRAARNLASVAPKDGTALGILPQTLPFDTLLGYTADID